MGDEDEKEEVIDKITTLLCEVQSQIRKALTLLSSSEVETEVKALLSHADKNLRDAKRLHEEGIKLTALNTPEESEV